MKASFITVIILLFSICGFSQTFVSGGIAVNTTWTLAGSPYIVTSGVTVATAAKLTIDPGVVVKFNPGTGLQIDGTLYAVGTVADSIEFTSNLASPSISSWNGINATWTGAPSAAGNQIQMDYVIGKYAYIFINMDLAYNGPYTFKHCYFAYNDKANYDGGMPSAVWEDCVFRSNNLGLIGCDFYDRVSRCFFVNNVDGVNGIENVDTCSFIGNTGIALQPYGSTIACNIQNNNIGVKTVFNSVNNTFKNNTVMNNTTGIQIGTYYPSGITFTGNTICNNTIYNIELYDPAISYPPFNANLSGNCWCTHDSSAIRAKIYDGYINSSHGFVTFLPEAGSCQSIILGINSVSENANGLIEAFPNPFTNSITINVKTTSTEELEVVLYDITSRKIMQKKFHSSVTLNTELFNPGIYIYQISNKAGLIGSGKVIKN